MCLKKCIAIVPHSDLDSLVLTTDIFEVKVSIMGRK